jgi:hypothetical protein
VGSEQLVAGNLGGESNVYVASEGVQVTDTDDRIRVYLGKLPSGGYGLQVVNGADVTIIDGTSDIFSIVASGTTNSVSFSNPANPGSTVTVTVATGFTFQPVHHVWVQAAQAHATPIQVLDNSGTALDWFRAYVDAVAPDATSINVAVASSRPSGTTNAYTFAWYILRQIAF